MTKQPRWWKVVEPHLPVTNSQHRQRLIEQITEENELADALGFNCLPDERRGFGFCYFVQSHRRHRVLVWETGDGWQRVYQRKKSNAPIYRRRYFYTLAQALRNENPRAYKDEHGIMHYDNIPQEYLNT